MNLLRRLFKIFTSPRPNVTPHVHEWGKWRSWGITYQRRECKTCGWAEMEDVI